MPVPTSVSLPVRSILTELPSSSVAESSLATGGTASGLVTLMVEVATGESSEPSFTTTSKVRSPSVDSPSSAFE